MNSPVNHDDHPSVVSRNARCGLALFAVYVLMYAGFIFMAVFRYEDLGEATPLGVNLAIVYGFGLIVGAIVLALVYVVLTWRSPRDVRDGEGGAQ